MTQPEQPLRDNRYEDLTGGDFLVGAGVSYVALAVSLALVLTWSVPGLAVDEFGVALVVALVYGTLVWLVVMVVVGFPLAFWIERRTPVDATLVRKFAPYLVAGVVIGTVLSYLHLSMAPISVICAVAGRIGAGWWRSRRRRRVEAIR